MYITRLFICLLIMFGPLVVSAQTPAVRAQIQAEIAARDIDQQEFERELAAAGIQLEGMSEEELIRERPRIEEIVNKLEAEKNAREETAKKEAVSAAQQIEEAVDEGASVKEAITEVTAAEAAVTLPPSNIYGHQIFRNKSLEVYRTTNNVLPPNSYPLKPGDRLGFTIFGASQTDFILEVDEQGFVKLPNGLRIPLAGVSLGDARTLLARRLKSYYSFRDGELSIRIQAARTITVNIFGEVENNGSFTLSSVNTAFNALVAAGGPTETGTVRNIQIIDGSDTRMVDVYEYLKNPTKNTEFFLSNNTTIFVPPSEKVVNLKGGVKRPLRYELKEGETLNDLLAFAGGPVTRAETGDIQITRYINGQLELISVDLTKSPDFELRNDDIIDIPVINNPIRNFVTIEGAVFLPGRYPITDSLTASKLLQQARLRPNARRDVAFLFRSNDDGTERLIRLNTGADAGAKKVVLQRGDRLNILASDRFVDRGQIQISGAIRDTNRTIPYPEDGAITLEEAILLSGGTTENAKSEAIITRTPASNREKREYLTIPLSEAASTTLRPTDRVTIYKQERFTDVSNISIGGAVRQPGTFRYDPSLSLSDAIYLAGGLRREAALDRVEVNRLNIVAGKSARTVVETIQLGEDGQLSSDFILQPSDQIIVRTIADYEKIRGVEVIGEVRYPGRYAIVKDKEKLTDVIKRAGGVTGDAFPEGATLLRQTDDIGYVVLSLDEALKTPATVSNMMLQAGDVLSIPSQQDVVTIFTRGTYATRFGADSTVTSNTLRVAYHGDKPASWYINNFAGGFNRERADKRSLTVEYANGQYQETSTFLGFKNYPEVKPGSSIRMDLKEEKVKKSKERRPDRFDWIRLTQVVLTGATTLVTFYLLRDR